METIQSLYRLLGCPIPIALRNTLSLYSVCPSCACISAMSWCRLVRHCCVEFFQCRRSVPLARAVYRLLERVHDFCAVSRAVQRHGDVPYSVFSAALAEPQVAFHIDVIYGSRWALPITRCHTHLRGQITRKKNLQMRPALMVVWFLQRVHKRVFFFYHFMPQSLYV